MLEHPDIAWIERTGYPGWMQDREEYDEDREEYDEDRAYEEAREREIFGER